MISFGLIFKPKTLIMKKNYFLPAFFILSVVAFSSCKKDYTCECTYKDSFNAPQTISIEYKDVKKSDAKDACANWTISGGSDFNCELK